MGRMGLRRDGEQAGAQAGLRGAGQGAAPRLVFGQNDLLVLDALGDFPGGVLFVSHDRHFVDELATETLHFEIT